MNQLNQFVQQMQSLFAGMNSQSKLMAILLTVGIAVSSVFLIQGATTGNGSMELLLDGTVFTEEELIRIEIALGNAKLRGHEIVGNRIKIPKSTSDEYLKAISDGKAVPERAGSAVENALNSNGFLESTKTTEAKLLRAKLKDVENAIKRLDTALIQEVFANYDEKRLGFSGDRKQVASVAVKTRGGRELGGEHRLAIISYVQHTFAGLKQSDIAIYCNNQATVASDDPATTQQTRYYQLKAQEEDRIRGEAERLLIDYGNVRLGVYVELDNVASEKTESLAFEPKPTKLQSVTSKKDAKSQRAGTGGKPGTETNTSPNRPQSISTPEQTSETKEQTESERMVAGNTLKQIDTIGLQTKKVSVSVSIPYSYYRKVALYRWRESNPDKSEKDFSQTESELASLIEETEKGIQKKISHILPNVAAGADSLPRVAVASYIDMPVPQPPAISLSEKALEWISHSWQTLALMGLVGAALVSLRSFAKTVPAANDRDFERGFDLPLDDAIDIDLSSLTDEENEAFDPQPVADDSPPRLRTTGGDIKNDLTAMVRENPDAAATLLRNWITEAS